MNELIDKFFIYFESIFRGRLPIKYKGIYIIENIWVIHYECLSVNPLNVDEAIKECIHIRYSVIHNKFVQLEATDEDFRNLSDLFEKTLKAFVCLDQTLKNQSIFFNQFKLQDYSEYKSERRNSIINNLIN
jgi:hypothetical protein